MTDDIEADDSSRSRSFGLELEHVARSIEYWSESGGAANFPSFAHNLCDLLGVPHPELSKLDVLRNPYDFKCEVTFQNLDSMTWLLQISPAIKHQRARNIFPV